MVLGFQYRAGTPTLVTVGGGDSWGLRWSAAAGRAG